MVTLFLENTRNSDMKFYLILPFLLLNARTKLMLLLDKVIVCWVLMNWDFEIIWERKNFDGHLIKICLILNFKVFELS